MKRFKLSRKEKLLFATPLLLLLLVLAWFLVSADSLDRKLRELAGPEAVDCGITSSPSAYYDPCAIAALKAGKPFLVRHNIVPPGNFHMQANGLAMTPQGELYSAAYFRRHWEEKAVLRYLLVLKPSVAKNTSGPGPREEITHDWGEKRHERVVEDRIWW